MTKSIFTLLLMVMFAAFTTTAQTADNSTETAQTQLDNCPLKGTSDCPLVKDCPKKGKPDCPYKRMASADNSEAAQKLENCPLKGTPGCPLVKNCPKQGQPDCPYKRANTTCGKGKKPSCCAIAKK